MLRNRRGINRCIKLVLVQLQQRRQGVGDLCLAVANQRRIGADRFHEDAGGQQIAFHIQDVAPARFQQRTRAACYAGP